MNQMKMVINSEEGGYILVPGRGGKGTGYVARCRPRAVDSVLHRYRVPNEMMGNGLGDQVPGTYAAVYAGVRVRPPGHHLRYWLHRSAWADLQLFDFILFIPDDLVLLRVLFPSALF